MTVTGEHRLLNVLLNILQVVFVFKAQLEAQN
jgi:hypothetical protein